MPSTEPIERSTLRVMITIVSPIASRAMIDAPESSCWMLVALRKQVVVDRGGADDDHEREDDPELAEAQQQLRDAVRARDAARWTALLFGERGHAALPRPGPLRRA